MPYVTWSRGSLGRHTMTRTRVRRWYNFYTGSWITDPPVVQVYTSPPMFGVIESVRSYRDPAGKPKGFAIHEFDRTKNTCVGSSSPGFSVTWEYKGWMAWEIYTDTFGGDFSWWRYATIGADFSDGTDGVDTGTLESKALLGAFADAKSPNFELGVNLGELRETFEMLRNPFNALQKYLTMPKWQRAMKGAKRDSAAGTWMEMRYGVMPLVYTIQDILRVLKKQEDNVVNELRTGRKSEYGSAVKQYPGTPISFDGWTMTPCRSCVKRVKVAAIAFWQYTETPTFGERLGIDISSIPEVIWELTRLSWLVDWFLDLGTFLRAHRSLPNISFLGTCVTTVTTLSSLQTATDVSYRGKRLSGECFNIFSESSTVKRVGGPALPQYPVVDLRWKSIVHTVDALALSWQSMPKNIKKILR